MIRWLFRLFLTLLAARLLVRATQGTRTTKTGPTPRFHPGADAGREKSPGHQTMTAYPIEDADYEELPRSGG